MGLFSKKGEVPSIPQSPTLATFPSPGTDGKKDLPELPSFPSSKTNENLNQEMVKSAVVDPSSPGEEDVTGQVPAEGQGLIPTIPAEENNQTTFPTPEPQVEGLPEMREPQKPGEGNIPESPNQGTEESVGESSPIFVRVDKFQDAQKHFDEIKGKVGEIEETLAKIKEIKDKEDQELESWNSEIEKLKSRLAEVDSEIFSQI